MKLTKDEALILASMISQEKFTDANLFERPLSGEVWDALTDLELRLEAYSDDKRRKGRKSQNSYTDVLKRFTLNFKRKNATPNLRSQGSETP